MVLEKLCFIGYFDIIDNAIPYLSLFRNITIFLFKININKVASE